MSTSIESPAVKHLFLDLEDTVTTPVVEGWADTELINCEKVTAFIAQFKPDFVHIFSFAVWNEQDLSSFDWSVRPRLEKALGVKLATVPLLDTEILQACCNQKWMSADHVTRKHVIDFWGKQEAFRLFTLQKYGKRGSSSVSNEVILLDDKVLNEEFAYPNMGLRGRLLDITELP